MRVWYIDCAGAFQALEMGLIPIIRSILGFPMTKWLKEVKEAIVIDGFSIVSIEACKHHKVTLEKDGIRFFVFVSKTTSDTFRGMKRVIQSVRQQYRESKEKSLTPPPS